LVAEDRFEIEILEPLRGATGEAATETARVAAATKPRERCMTKQRMDPSKKTCDVTFYSAK
jgi:hypothetical protein